MTDAGTKRGLNNEDLELELDINGDWRLSNRSLIKKSNSPGAVVLTAPPLDPPLPINS